MTGSAGELRVVALCMAPAEVHTAQNLRFSTQAIIDGLGAAFDASKATPLDQLVFIDIARIEELLEMLPKPTPPYPKAEEMVMNLALSDQNIGLRIRENLDLLKVC